MNSITIATTLLFSSLSFAGSIASDWPNYRGPQHNGVSAEKNWIDTWPDQGPAITWKARVGLGFSSMVVQNGRLASAGHADKTDTVYCFDATTGKELWKHSYPAELGDKYYEGGTTGTPTFADGKLYWLSRWGDLICFQADTGRIVWEKNIQKETGAKIPTWGYTGAPLVHDNLLVLNVGEAGTAVDKTTGKLVWKSGNADAGYATPLPIQRNGKWLALLSNGENYLAVDIQSGAEAWRFKWLTEYGVNAADPVVTGDHVYISSGYGKGGTLIKTGSGQPESVWKNKALRTQLNPAVLHEGHLYGPDGDTGDKGALKCIELQTGTEKWAHKGFGTGGLIVADGKIIALSSTGELLVAPATPSGFKPTSRAQVIGGKCWTAPVLANGLIYCRNSKGEIVAVNVKRN